MNDFLPVLAFWAAFAVAVASPGPNFAVILRTALSDGRPRATRVALGMVLGEGA